LLWLFSAGVGCTPAPAAPPAQDGGNVLRVLRILPKEGPPETYPADAPDQEIDVVAVRPAERFELLEPRVIEERVISDHRPVLAVLRLDGPGAAS